MKRSLLSMSLLLITLVSWGQADKPVDSKIKNVTVFLNRAQVTREVQSVMEPGKTNLIITGLTSQLDPESIQVTGKGRFIILGISHRQNYLTEMNTPTGLKAMKDSLGLLQDQVIMKQSEKEILTREEQMLLSNQKIGGANTNLTVAELKAMADFYRSRLTEIVKTKLKHDDKIKMITARIEKLQRQIDAQNELYARNTSEIVVSLSATAPTTVALEVNYIVANAGWNAVYDLRAINTKSPLQLSYKANVFQSTGETWENVRLKLSTANPSLSGLKPELEAWYLSLGYSRDKYKTMMGAMSAPAAESVAGQYNADMKEKDALSTSAFVSTIQTSLNTEFDISLPYTVLSSSKPTLVEIRNYEMKADYRYSVAPKLDNDAFLIARATGWEEFSLLPGEANIFFEGSFVGKTIIDPNNTNDTLSVSLGRDKRIIVKREKQKELSSRRLIGTNQRDSYAWEISVRNNKAESIKIVIEDQIPVSQNSQIEVIVSELNGAKFEKESGKLTWELDLQPNENRKLVFKYEVKYPKGKELAGL